MMSRGLHNTHTDKTLTGYRKKMASGGFISLFCALFLFLYFLAPARVTAETSPYAPESIEGVIKVTAEETIDLILNNPELLIIDSRKRTEYVKGHIEGAVNILNTEITEPDIQKAISHKDNKILFYCNGVRCLRSTDAIRKVKSWGYKNLYWLRGGWKEWTDKRLPYISE